MPRSISLLSGFLAAATLVLRPAIGLADACADTLMAGQPCQCAGSVTCVCGPSESTNGGACIPNYPTGLCDYPEQGSSGTAVCCQSTGGGVNNLSACYIDDDCCYGHCGKATGGNVGTCCNYGNTSTAANCVGTHAPKCYPGSPTACCTTGSMCTTSYCNVDPGQSDDGTCCAGLYHPLGQGGCCNQTTPVFNRAPQDPTKSGQCCVSGGNDPAKFKCTQSADCCGYSPTGGGAHCNLPAGTCTNNTNTTGEPCNTSADCATGYLCEGYYQCALATCHILGQSCIEDGDCCSPNDCNNGTCQARQTGPGHCSENQNCAAGWVCAIVIDVGGSQPGDCCLPSQATSPLGTTTGPDADCCAGTRTGAICDCAPYLGGCATRHAPAGQGCCANSCAPSTTETPYCYDGRICLCE